MICFLDSSALVKCYIEEPGSNKVQDLLSTSKVIAVSQLAYPETLSAMIRRRVSFRNVSDAIFNSNIKNFRRDWTHFLVLPITEETLLHIDRLIQTYRLRGADSIHLSTVITFRAATKSPLTFVASDNELLSAAGSEHLTILDPTL
jgi:uncharacterized protein